MEARRSGLATATATRQPPNPGAALPSPELPAQAAGRGKAQAASAESVRKAAETSTNAVQACWLNFAALQPRREMAEESRAGAPLPAAVLRLAAPQSGKHRFPAAVRGWRSFQKDGT